MPLAWFPTTCFLVSGCYIETLSEESGINIPELMHDSSNFTLVLNALVKYWNESKDPTCLI